ncbi:hypothetical protein [Clostridium sp. HMP27]|uniref:hypothetical protein n=1 Tax=Clostridium sp. HMP27 TaxID=1487921 RepID=UPI00052B7119|nr:hypothetical protein [Clostridium sp. HMP27]KGK86554.1 hypothetical protein DP68_13165 [Clostridium sp. HMP27]
MTIISKITREIAAQINSEIEKEQKKRAIPKKLLDTNFKIHISHKKTIENVLESIEDKIIMPILNIEEDDDTKIQRIVELVSSNENIYLHIDKISNIYEKKNVIEKLVTGHDCFDKKELLDNTVLRVNMQDNQGNRVEIISMLNIKLEHKTHNEYRYLTEVSDIDHYYSDFSSIISKIYLLNELYKFLRNNLHIVEYPIIESMEDFDYINVSSDKALNIVSDLKKKYSLNYKIHMDRPSKVKPIVRLIEEDTFNICNNFIIRRNVINSIDFPEDVIHNIDLALRYIKKENKKIENEVKLNYSGYALTYETKRNIPTKTLGKMKENKFLKWFGYVEIDEQCDLNKIIQLEEEFEKYMERINSKNKIVSNFIP